MKISCYETSAIKLPKAFCALAEKCYYNNLPTLVITSHRDLSILIDTALWTYSRRHFIPHGTSYDPYPFLQPVYITEQLENPNKATALIFINIRQEIILSILAGTADNKSNSPGVRGINFLDFQRVFFLYADSAHDSIDESASAILADINDILQKSMLQSLPIENFKQDDKGNWERITYTANECNADK